MVFATLWLISESKVRYLYTFNSHHLKQKYSEKAEMQIDVAHQEIILSSVTNVSNVYK